MSHYCRYYLKVTWTIGYNTDYTFTGVATVWGRGLEEADYSVKISLNN